MILEWDETTKEEIYIFACKYAEKMAQIRIHFKNDKFSHVIFGFNGSYDRKEWEILTLIERKITDIEIEKRKTNDAKRFSSND